jgi:hypothetical protein
MRTISMKRAIRNTFFRLGPHATPKAVVHTLARQGIQVSAELVRQVRFELLKETTGGRKAEASMTTPSAAVCRRPQGFPRR